ncbi:MAG: hypothetical protein ACXVGH_11705, partial [Mycobacteriales bacterium]
GWAQAFVLPADGGRYELHYAQGSRRAAVVAQLLLLAVVVVLSLPAGRRRRGLEDDPDQDQEDDVLQMADRVPFRPTAAPAPRNVRVTP